jgi:hypothetical protein
MTAKVGYLADLDSKMDKFIDKLRDNINKNIDITHNYHNNTKLESNDVFKFNVYGQKKDPDGNKVTPEIIYNKRTTYWVPTVQTY